MVFKISGHVLSVASALVLSVTGCGSATVGTSAAGKWVGPPMPAPGGGEVRTTIYYGPWLCSAAFMSRCERRCGAEGHALMGCMWLADIKGDWQGRFLGLPAAAGGRMAITHCCCDYPKVADLEHRRKTWDRARPDFRTAWSTELGAWPKTATGKHWPGHHIRDLAHGGDPTAPANVLPTPEDVHNIFGSEYPGCYAPGGKWRTTGPERPYVD